MKLCIIYTGGTIGCIGKPLAPMPPIAFQQAFDRLIAPIIQTKYPNCQAVFGEVENVLDSTNIQPSDWCAIASVIIDNYLNYDAFLVLHGTDTLAWTASALSFLLTGLNEQGQAITHLDKPVILTGSQLPLFSQNDLGEFSLHYHTDALNNICGAIAAINAKIQEVGVYFHHQLLRGNRCLKTNACTFDAFSSPNYPALAQHEMSLKVNYSVLLGASKKSGGELSHQASLTRVKTQLAQISACINQNIVISFLAFPAYYGGQTNVLAQLFNSALNIPHVVGVVLESYGAGNFPAGNTMAANEGLMYQALKAAQQQGVVVINCTQVLTAVANANSYASGSWLTDVGVVDAHDLSAIAALTKLSYLSAVNQGAGFGWSSEFIAYLMTMDIVGEISNSPSCRIA